MHVGNVLTRYSGIFTLLFFCLFFGVFFMPAEIGKFMASGDAAVESIPALLGARHMWEPSMLLGYPLYADPNQQQWYPLAWLAALPHFYNAFAVAPFPIVAFGICGFVRSATRSSIAGIVSGLVFALGGFMISHAGHLMISHPAAWAPYVLWSIEAQRRKYDPAATAAGAVALGLCAVSGQPQVLAFTIAIATTYAVVSAPASRRRSFAIGIALTLAIGVGLGSVQLVPEAALASGSTRASLSFADYTALEIPASQLAMRAVFPYALGVTRLPGYSYSGADLGTFTEETIAVGIVAIFLALFASTEIARDRRILYWFAIAVLALLLAVGDATPLATLTHSMPVYGLLRIPGRHAFEWTLAIAILAGYGSAAIRSGRASLRSTSIAIGIVFGVVAIGYLQFANGTAPNATSIATTYNVAVSTVASPQTNGALKIPLVVGLLGLVIVCTAVRFRRGRASAVLLATAVALDTGTFAYAAYWNWAAVEPSSIEPAAFVASLAARLNADGSRVAWFPGNLAGALAPNLTTLWHVPTIDGYSPLVPKRAMDLLGSTPSGGITIPSSREVNLDIAGASIVATQAAPTAARSANAPFAEDSIHLFFSARHTDGVSHADLGLQKSLAATSLTYVSELGDSVNVPQNADVATITIVFTDRTSESHDILAGRDTAEFAFDRLDVRPLMKHARATIYSSEGSGHTYVSSVPIKSYKPVSRIGIQWHYATAALTLEKVSLVDAALKSAYPFDTLASLYADPNHWKPIAIDPAILAFRNARALPHAWIAQPVRVDSRERSVVMIRTGAFAARSQALIEEPIDGVFARPLSTDVAKVETNSGTDVVAAVTCARACFVVDRDAYDSDWKADVDGAFVRTYATDIDLRGVVVPAGRHRLHFHFFPFSLAIGSTITLIAALLIVLIGSSAENGRSLRTRFQKRK